MEKLSEKKHLIQKNDDIFHIFDQIKVSRVIPFKHGELRLHDMFRCVYLEKT